MAGGIKIPFLADVAKFIKGTDSMAESLEDVAGALDDLGKNKAGEDLEDGLKSAGKEAGELESKVSDAFRSIAQDAKDAGKKTGDSIKDGTGKAKEGFDELKGEASGTAREAAASFGSIEDGADALQEVLANAFVGFGPAGAAAGLAAAAGIGLAITAAQDAATANTDAKQKAVDMIDAIAEAGGNIENLDFAERIKSWGREVLEDNWMTFWADESSTKFQETAKDAETFGVSVRDAIRAASGSAEDSKKFLDATGESWQELNAKVEAGTRVNEDGAMSFTDSAVAAQKQRDALSDLRGQAEENIATTENAVEIYGIEQEAMDNSAEATERANEALKERADALDESATAAMGADQAELDYVKTLQQSAKDIESNGKTVDINTEAGRANRETLLEMASSARELIDAQIAQGDSTATVTKTTDGARTAFINAATAAGMTKDEAKKLADQYGLIPGNVDTHVKAHNVANTKAEIDGVAAPRTAVVNVAMGTNAVARHIEGMNGSTVFVNVTPRSPGGRGITD
jgi:hypothetical protein